MQNGTATREMSLAVSYEEITPLLRIYPRKIKTILRQNLCMNVCGRSIYYHPKLETTQMSFKSWIRCALINKLWDCYTKGHYSGMRYGYTPQHGWILEAEWKKPAWEGSLTCWVMKEAKKICTVWSHLHDILGKTIHSRWWRPDQWFRCCGEEDRVWVVGGNSWDWWAALILIAFGYPSLYRC